MTWRLYKKSSRIWKRKKAQFQERKANSKIKNSKSAITIKIKKSYEICIRKTKAQITIFMVVGLVILIGGAIFFYLTSKAPTQFKPEIKIVQEQIPLEFDPIK